MTTLSPASVPASVLEVVRGLKQAGHQAFLVGGCVRDLLRGQPPKDFDVATSARPEVVQGLFRRVIPTGIDHGTVTVVVRGEHVEVTTFRAESDYVDGRRPGKVEFHEEIEADLSRRDFTMNAIAWDPDENRLVDPFAGQVDLQGRVVRCVRSALERFSEDGLRPLRAVRFATVLDFTLEPETEAAIPKTLDVFRKVAAERVQQEFAKLLLAPGAARGLDLLSRTGLLDVFLPEAKGADFAAVPRAPKDEATRLAVLLYAAPRVREVVTRLKFPGRVAEDAGGFVTHGALPAPDASDVELRRWAARVDRARVAGILSVHEARQSLPAPLKARLEAVLASNPPLSTRDLALDGKAIMAALGVGPSRAVGEATRFLLEAVLQDPSQNAPERLEALLKGWKPQG